MAKIEILDHNTIDQIAAGEVVERPASVVKELVENSIDAKADAITVEIRNGGIDFIRVTDNGCGIAEEDMKKAFLRHATSKIRNLEDLENITSMGFRGEALASISSVSKVEVVSKCPDKFIGIRYEICGGDARDLDEVGAPDGTTIVVRDLFYNTPARRKFLKTEKTEGVCIIELMEHIALARPDISFELIVNHKTRFSTSGNGDLKEVIYRIYGRDMAREVVPFSYEQDGIVMEGYLGTPAINQSNRNMENYFVNNRYIKSDIIAKGIEQGYRAYLMQHKFPFCVIHFNMNAKDIDVNVHPSKMEVRFHHRQEFYDSIVKAVEGALLSREMIASLSLEEEKKKEESSPSLPQPFEVKRREEMALGSNRQDAPNVFPLNSNREVIFSTDFSGEDENQGEDFQKEDFQKEDFQKEDFQKEDFQKEDALKEDFLKGTSLNDNLLKEDIFKENTQENFENNGSDARKEERISEQRILDIARQTGAVNIHDNVIKQKDHIIVEKPVQLSLFEEEDRVLSAKARKQYQIIGQVFKTYWILTYQDKLYFVDQHAAHEKVNYERLMKQVSEGHVPAQQCNPPLIITLSGKDQITLSDNLEYFHKLGFMIEEFGGNEYAVREIPMELYFNDPKEMIQDVLQEMSEVSNSGTPEAITSRIATMACKASVKGGMNMTREEMEALIDEMLTLDNPYHCPHGRPTIFSMSRTELEKKFKRIVD